MQLGANESCEWHVWGIWVAPIHQFWTDLSVSCAWIGLYWVYKCKQKVSERNVVVPEQWNWIVLFLQDVLSASPPARTETTAKLQLLSSCEGQAFFLPKACNQKIVHGSLWQSLHLSLQSSSGIFLCFVQVLNANSLHLLLLEQNKASTVSLSSTG